MNTQFRSGQRRFVTAPLALALLACFSLPALAQDVSCVRWDDDTQEWVEAPERDTDKGIEYGLRNATCWDGATAFGLSNNASGFNSVAMGYANRALNDQSVAVGMLNHARGFNSSALGVMSAADASYSTSVGMGNSVRRSAHSGSAFGFGNFVDGQLGVALGAGNSAAGDYSTAVGVLSFAQANYSTAIGYQAVATEEGVVSFGHQAGDQDRNGYEYTDTRLARLINIDRGINDHDAVNVEQVREAWYSLAESVMHYADAGDARTLADANAYTDARETAIRADISASSQQTLADASAYADAGDARTLEQANAHADAGDAQTLASANEHTNTREAVIRSDMSAADAQTLASARAYADQTATQAVTTANAYTDARFTALNDSFEQYRVLVDERFTRTDRRISRVGAIAGALTAMSANAVPAQPGNGRMAVGASSQNGQTAMAIGYGKRFDNGASFTLGAGFSGRDNNASVGVGFDL